MWEYNQTPMASELYHYGVPGMKWGVRRQIAASARTGARQNRLARSSDKRVARLERRQQYQRQQGLNSRRLSASIKKEKARGAMLKSAAKKSLKGLSAKDIKKGERQAKSVVRNLGPALMFGLVGAAATGIGIRGDYKRSLKRTGG